MIGADLVADAETEALKGVEVAWIEGPSGLRMRAAFAPARGRKLAGSAIVLPGRTEYIEKHAPTARDLIARGFHVLIVDQRGQGLSDRMVPDHEAGHMDDFAHAAAHVGAAIAAFDRQLKGPRLLVSHSMGGCVALEALLGGHAPGVAGAVFCAPMWGLRAPFWARHLAALLTRAGRGGAVAPTTPTRWTPEAFDGNALTHDPRHHARNNALCLEEPRLRLAGPTNGWLDAAFRALDAFTPARLAAQQVPALVVTAGADTVIDNAAHARVAGQMPRATLRVVPGGKHELLHERADLRQAFWDHVDAWLAAEWPGAARPDTD